MTFCIFLRSSGKISTIHWAWKFAWLNSIHNICRTQFTGKSILSLLKVKLYRIYLRSLHYQVMSKSVCNFNLIIGLWNTKYFPQREMQFSFSHETSIDVNYIILFKCNIFGNICLNVHQNVRSLSLWSLNLLATPHLIERFPKLLWITDFISQSLFRGRKNLLDIKVLLCLIFSKAKYVISL